MFEVQGLGPWWGRGAKPPPCLPPTQLGRHTRGADRVVALGFCAPACGWVVPNDYVADYVARDPARLIGFGSVDPNDPGAPDELERMRQDLGLRGCKLAPIYQDADPLGEGFLRVWERLPRRPGAGPPPPGARPSPGPGRSCPRGRCCSTRSRGAFRGS